MVHVEHELRESRRNDRARPHRHVSGIAPAGIPGFILAQLLGALTGTLLFQWIGKESVIKLRNAFLFLCTHKPARSQMAEGLLRKMAGDQFEVFSAGTEQTRDRLEIDRGADRERWLENVPESSDSLGCIGGKQGTPVHWSAL